MKLSIILLTWNSEKFIKNCMDSLLHAVDGYDYEIIVIDNNSTDNSLAMMHKYADNRRVKIFEMTENLGVAAGRNYGIKQSSGDYIWLLDIDTIPCKKAIDAMVDMLRRKPDCGICGCKLMHSSGEIQNSCRKYPRLRYKILNILASKLQRFGALHRLIERANSSQFYFKEMSGNYPFEVEYIIGACQLIRRQVVDKIGLLDQAIFYGPEDADFCLRAKKSGWSTVYIPTVSFIHDYQRLSNKKLFSAMSRIHIKALLHFWWKHKLI